MEHSRVEPRKVEKLIVSGEEAVVIAMSTNAAGVGAENGTSINGDRPTHTHRSNVSRRKRAARRCAVLFCPVIDVLTKHMTLGVLMCCSPLSGILCVQRKGG